MIKIIFKIRIFFLILILTKISDVLASFNSELNQIAFSIGYENSKNQKLLFPLIRYSQPTTFFRLKARRNIEVGFRIRMEKAAILNNNQKEVRRLPTAGASLDLLFERKILYFFLGGGGYLRPCKTKNIGSLFVFEATLGVGKALSNTIIEFFAKHFSNGALGLYNSGENFFGISVGLNF